MACPTLVGTAPMIGSAYLGPLGFTDSGATLWGTLTGLASAPYPALTSPTVDGRFGVKAIDAAEDAYAVRSFTSPSEVRILRITPGGTTTTLYTDNADGNASNYELSLHPTDGQLYGLRSVSAPSTGLYSFDPSAGGRTTIATGLSGLSKPAVTENYVWWITNGGNLSRVPVGGGSVSTVSVGWSGSATPIAGPDDELLVIQGDMQAFWEVDASMGVSSLSCTDEGTMLGQGFTFATRTDFAFSVYNVISGGVQYVWRWPAPTGGWTLGKAGWAA